jgi:acetyl-CoA carboxylase beta subunit
LDTVIDENSVKVYDESQNAFNPIKITDYNEALKKEKNTMIDDALKQGILKEANEQAKLAISALLQGLGFEKIEVTEEIALPELH